MTEDIIRYDELAQEAMRGVVKKVLTQARDAGGAYPASGLLCELAEDARAVVGGDVEISYAADWTEYGAHVVGDDVAFPLDPLWAHADIDYVGLDWYAPMADWRDGEVHADAGWGDGRSLAYLDANIEGGEAFDWYYVDEAGRGAQERLPITDGAYDEPWVFRQKDIRSWWSNAHHPRAGGVRAGSPTEWTPGMKPVRFVEAGCSGVDKGANQPNVFYDPKSSESALPHYSDSSRDDLIQRRAMEALHLHWNGQPMIPADGICLWAWDARPYPAFPLREDVWADGGNWRLGHWLNGRTGLALLPDLVSEICAKAGAAFEGDTLSGVITGYRFDGRTTARQALEPLMLAYGLHAVESEGVLSFRMSESHSPHVLDANQVILRSEETARGGMEAPEVGVLLRYPDDEADQAPAAITSGAAADADTVSIDLPLAINRDRAEQLVERLAEEMTRARERLRVELDASGLRFEPGDVIEVGGELFRIGEISTGQAVVVSCVRAGAAPALVLSTGLPANGVAATADVTPDLVVIDAPPMPGDERDDRPLVAAFSEPWTGPVTILAGPEAGLLSQRARIDRPSRIGRLIGPLFPHVSGRWQDADILVALPSGNLASTSDLAVLNGGNWALVESGDGWEAIQYSSAELMESGVWRLSRLLRGQQGSEAAMSAGAVAGARILFLTGGEQRLELGEHERDLELLWRAFRRRPDEASAVSEPFAWQAVGRRMWSPVRMGANWNGGDIELGWVRRSRIGGDGWGAVEPPLEGEEAYRVRVTAGGMVLREWETATPSAVYPEAWREEDRPEGGSTVFEVCQLGPGWEAGYSSTLALYLPTT